MSHYDLNKLLLNQCSGNKLAEAKFQALFLLLVYLKLKTKVLDEYGAWENELTYRIALDFVSSLCDEKYLDLEDQHNQSQVVSQV